MIKIHINSPWIVSLVSIVTNRRCATLKGVSPRFFSTNYDDMKIRGLQCTEKGYDSVHFSNQNKTGSVRKNYTDKDF